jgi:hypothetical protein
LHLVGGGGSSRNSHSLANLLVSLLPGIGGEQYSWTWGKEIASRHFFAPLVFLKDLLVVFLYILRKIAFFGTVEKYAETIRF